LTALVFSNILCCCVSGSDKAVFVADKHAVNFNPMKPPFPAGTELAMFGQASVHHWCRGVCPHKPGSNC